MPRVRGGRRALLSLTACAALSLLALTLRPEAGPGVEPWPPDDHEEPTPGRPVQTTPEPAAGRALDLSPLEPGAVGLPAVEARPWYMAGGLLRPGHCPACNVTLWPEERRGDRLRDQLMYLPANVNPEDQQSADTPLKKILFWNGASGWGVRPGRGIFIKEQCPVSSCAIATNRREGSAADLVVFKDHFTMPGMERRPDQLWMIFMLESPLHTQLFKHKEVFNWTATYRSDSTVVAPYERWQYYNDNVRERDQEIDYAANKTKKVGWFVSNCGARNGRLEYARNLSKYIQVDIYGSCGDLKCPRASKDCLALLDTDYKFYLAFENSNCVDYITEKFFVNGLKHNVLPIVMGASREAYERRAPHRSFIHVDDFASPAQLAEYLHRLHCTALHCTALH
jgi:glycoprotein 3-alpha-L-fucosyltransferase